MLRVTALDKRKVGQVRNEIWESEMELQVRGTASEQKYEKLVIFCRRVFFWKSNGWVMRTVDSGCQRFGTEATFVSVMVVVGVVF